jgi:hypothetical protein
MSRSSSSQNSPDSISMQLKAENIVLTITGCTKKNSTMIVVISWFYKGFKEFYLTAKGTHTRTAIVVIIIGRNSMISIF